MSSYYIFWVFILTICAYQLGLMSTGTATTTGIASSAVADDKERAHIHKMVCNIVQLPRMKQICDELYLLMKEEKVLTSIKPEAMLAELRRIGMPSADTPGFSDQNFYSNYRT